MVLGMIKDILKHISVFLLAAFVLTGCSTMGSGDGGPNGHFDASKVPDATPKVEPLSKYGNSPSYVVAGHRYYVLQDAKGYDKVGTASWYGTKFHGKYTSSREPYDMFSMTAASTTLPIPTYVRVTNLDNGRSTVVKVNDRGPFKSSRLIDLSYAAASKLGYTGSGTAKVRVTAIDPTDPNFMLLAQNDTPLPPLPAATKAADTQSLTSKAKGKSAHIQLAQNDVATSKASSGKGKYFQVGAYASRQKAESISRQIANVAQLSKTQVAVKEGYSSQKNSPVYRVHIGPLADSGDSKRVTQALTQHGFGKPVPVTG
jgi:rare lipoprotein A